jgi:hypothetical protein
MSPETQRLEWRTGGSDARFVVREQAELELRLVGWIR